LTYQKNWGIIITQRGKTEGLYNTILCYRIQASIKSFHFLKYNYLKIKKKLSMVVKPLIAFFVGKCWY